LISVVETANAHLSLAKERYEDARLGPTREERAIADAGVEIVAAAVAAVGARVAKSRISEAPDGTVACSSRSQVRRLYWASR
jgi:HlyD family secretion protein